MGHTDAIIVKSHMALFHIATEGKLFKNVMGKYYGIKGQFL